MHTKFNVVESANIFSNNVYSYALTYSFSEKELRQSHTDLPITIPEQLKNAHPKRRYEFSLGRYCLSMANRKKNNFKNSESIIDYSDYNLTERFGTDIVASITHTKGYICAAVGNLSQVRSIGIDSEQLLRHWTKRHSQKILTNTERESFSSIQDLTLVFSAKESLFKALYPITKSFFWFQDACITHVDRQHGYFEYEVKKQLSHEFSFGYRGEGRFLETENIVHTSIEIESVS